VHNTSSFLLLYDVRDRVAIPRTELDLRYGDLASSMMVLVDGEALASDKNW
jgi:hypothetical protein